MTKAHELDRSKQTAPAAPHHDDAVAPGRIARSAALVGPNGPMPSGLIQRKARDANGVEEGAGDAVARASSSSGAALPEGLMRKFESSLGADLSGVRVHTGSESAEAASAVGAKAYTLGQDIHFGAGHFDPSSTSGEHLLAHEVAHTVQQRGDIARMQLKPSVSSPGDAHEVEADRAADAMVTGQAFALANASGLSRQVMRKGEGGGEGGGAVHGFELEGELGLGETEIGEGSVGNVKASAKVAGKLQFKGTKEAGSGQSSAGGVLAGGQAGTQGEKKEGDKKEEKGPELGVKGEREKDKANVELELKQEYAPDNWGIAREWKIGTVMGKDHVGLKGSLTLKHKFGGVGTEIALDAIKAKILDFDKGTFTPLSVSTTGQLKIPVLEYTTRSGYHLKITLSGAVTLEAKPDWAKIIADLAERYASEAAVDASVSAGAAAGAAAAVALMAFGAYSDVLEGSDIGKMVGDANQAISDYVTCYSGAMHGGAAGAAGKYGAQGFQQGSLDRAKLLAKYPESIVNKIAPKAIAEVAASAKAKFQQEAIAKFKGNHRLMTYLRGGATPSDFDDAMKGSMANAGGSSSGTVAKDDVGRSKIQEMEIINGATAKAIGRVTAWGQGKVWSDIDENVGYLSGGSLGVAVPIKRLDIFPPGPQKGAFVSAQLERAFELNGREGGDWAKRMGIDPHAAPDEAKKAELINEMADNLLKFQHVVALIKLVPTQAPRNASVRGNPEAESQQKYQDSMQGGQDSQRQRDVDNMTE